MEIQDIIDFEIAIQEKNTKIREQTHNMSRESVRDLKYIPIEEIESARERAKGLYTRTPLLKIDVSDLVPDNRQVYIKLENLQDGGAYKVRGAGNMIKKLIEEDGEKIFKYGVYTTSSGNFALGLSHICCVLGVPCTVIVPGKCPDVKVNPMRRNKAKIIYVAYDIWWDIMVTHKYADAKEEYGKFVHPVVERDVIAGNATLGLELMEDLDHIDYVISPYGGGGLSTGVGSALHVKCPSCKVYVCEVECACPLYCSFKNGRPSWDPNHKETYVDGMGGKSVFDVMWNLATTIISDSILLSLENISKAVRLLVERRHIVAEGAGAASLAVALGWHDYEKLDLKDKTIVCIVSGGNLNSKMLSTILKGEVPQLGQ